MGVDKERNILIVTIGSAGDVYPFLALAVGLKQRGHHVTLVTSMYFEDLIHKEGIDFIPVGTREDYLNIIQNPNLWHPQKSLAFYGNEVVSRLIRPVYEIIVDYMETYPDAVLIAHGLVFAARVAHEKHGYPFVSIHLQPAAFRSAFEMPLLPEWVPPQTKRILFDVLDRFVLDPALSPALNAFRKELGLEPVKKLLDKWIHSPQKTIGLFPDWYAHVQPDWPPQTELTGFVLYDPNHDAPLSREVMRFLDEGEAPIVFTPGTSFKHGQDFFKASLQACQLLKMRGIFLTKYPEQIPESLPESVRHFEYVPLGTLLPHTSALVHHGGVGTLAQALKAGIPQLIRPVAQDQPDNAARLELLGLGQRLSPDKYTEKNVATKLNHLLTSDKVKAACMEATQKVNPAEAMQKTCEAIENLAL